jgi:histidine triad (HIT) family protein
MLFIPRYHKNIPLYVGQAFAIAQKYGLHRQRTGSKPDFNLIINQGPAAGQTIDHAHIHYVPRYENDGLHLPWWDQ